MVSRLEKKAREMDDLSKTAHENAIEISKITGLKEVTIITYLTAKRRGFESSYAYRIDLAKKIGYRSWHEYQLYATNSKISHSKRNLIINLDPNTISLNELRGSERTSMPTQEESIQREQLYSILEGVINFLKPREQDIIYSRFYSNETFEEIGTRLGMTKQRVEQIEKRTQIKMRELIGQRGLTQELLASI